jgi:hypothetical protein
MGNSSSEQVDFSAGIYRGLQAPSGSVYDAVNALLTDDGKLFKRGTSSYLTTSDAGEALAGLSVGYCAAPADTRVLAWNTAFRVVSGSGWVTLAAAGGYPLVNQPVPGSRMAAVNGALVWPAKNAQAIVVAYGGSLKSSAYTTGAGTTWTGNVDAGMLLQVVSSTGQTAMPVVEKVNSNTSLTLLYPWTGTTVAGAVYSLAPAEGSISAEQAMQAAGVPFSALGQTVTTPTYVASIGRRLLVANANVVAFSDIDGPRSIPATNFHVMPVDAYIVGLDGIDDSAFVFTTRGIFAIENLLFDPVDDAGNIQQIVRLINKDVVLWGDAGIAAWASGMVVPAINDVYVLSSDGSTEPISESIRPLYRSYVKAGYQPGTATVHRSHYFLPILNGTTVVDVLVCRLDRGAAWTRWAGHAAAGWFATQIGATTRSPKLYGASGQRVVDLTGCMDVTSSSMQDADSTTPTFRVDENDIDTGAGIRPNTTEKVRYVYETTGGTPTISVSYATGPEGSSYTAATLKRGGGSSTGVDYSAWKVAKKAERIRFRFECTSQVTSLILRRREATIREQAQS